MFQLFRQQDEYTMPTEPTLDDLADRLERAQSEKRELAAENAKLRAEVERLLQMSSEEKPAMQA